MMDSVLYRALLRLHPRTFRERFGPEMLDIFEQEHRTGRRAALLMDAFTSTVRQRMFAQASQKPPLPVAEPGQLIRGPVFQIFESELPRRSALVNGAIITVALLSVINFTSARGGSTRQWLISGTSSRPYVLPVKQSPATTNELQTQVEVASPPASPVDQKAKDDFTAVQVFRALDTDRNGIISASEIVGATSALVRLDTNKDGKLDPQECGTTEASMRHDPTLSVLDADRDFKISTREIEGAAAALRTLDVNRDGMLTSAEVHP